jgi:hypothetical protein
MFDYCLLCYQYYNLFPPSPIALLILRRLRHFHYLAACESTVLLYSLAFFGTSFRSLLFSFFVWSLIFLVSTNCYGQKAKEEIPRPMYSSNLCVQLQAFSYILKLLELLEGRCPCCGPTVTLLSYVSEMGIQSSFVSNFAHRHFEKFGTDTSVDFKHTIISVQSKGPIKMSPSINHATKAYESPLPSNETLNFICLPFVFSHYAVNDEVLRYHTSGPRYWSRRFLSCC